MDTLNNIGEVWRRAGMVQKVLLLTVVLGCAGAGVMLVSWVRTPKMTLLVGGVSPEEAQAIAQKIQDSGVTYEVRGDGSSIYVPEDQARKLRMEVMAAGLAGGGRGGYKILDDEKIGASPFTQSVNLKRALEGELAKTIEMLDGVARAKVLIARPEGSIFGAKDKDPSASVTVTLRTGTHLTGSNVVAITQLVAAAVDGLKGERVVVVDSQGDLLSRQGETDSSRGASSILDLKSQWDRYFKDEVETLLNKALGPNRASVRVDATVDMSSMDQTTERMDEKNRVVIEETMRSSSTPGKSGTGDGAGPAAGGKTDDTTTKYQAGKTVERKTELPGVVKSVSVAALVDLTPPAAKEGQPAPTALMTIEDVKELIQKAIPLAKPETLKVVNVPFQAAPAVAAAADAGEDSREFYLDIAKRSSLGILVIGVLVAMKLLGGPKRKGAAAGVAGGAAALTAGAGNMLGNESDPDVLRSRIANALQENPEEVKRLFLSWVQSEKVE